MNGLYNRTPAHLFPGKAQQEGSGGFEGQYSDNGSDFVFGGTPPAPEPAPAPMTCPFAPDAVVVTTESPVEIIATPSGSGGTPGAGAESSRGGGGAFGWLGLLAMLSMLGSYRLRSLTR